MRRMPVCALFALAILVPITAAGAEQSVGDSGLAIVDGSYIWTDLGGGNHYCPPDCGAGSTNIRDREAGARAWLLVEADSQAALRNNLALWGHTELPLPGSHGSFLAAHVRTTIAHFSPRHGFTQPECCHR